MSALADIFASVRLQLDGTGFEAQATALADKSGKNVGDTLSANLSASLKKAALGAIGAGAGAALGVMSKGAMELDAATQKLAADTGLSGQALADQAKSISALYGNSLQSMGDVEHALSIEISAYKLTGQAAQDAALGVIKFEEATGQSADAIDTLKEITDVYNLSAADQGHMMDLLVASHQKYSTNVGESQAALLKMGPALSAMNMGLDDGVALLNLFETAGISATKAPMALQAAIKTLKPGQDMNDLIAQISSIVDPTERAQAAMKIFQVRGGVQMAQAFQPGIVSLDQYKTKIEDTADASTKAADAIESSWVNVATKIVHTIEGPLAEIGQSIMPLMLVGSMFGPKMAAALGGIGGLLAPKIGAELGAMLLGDAVQGPVLAGGESLGRAGGMSFGGAFGAAAAIAIPAAIVAAVALGIDELAKTFDPSGANRKQWEQDALNQAAAGKYLSVSQKDFLGTKDIYGSADDIQSGAKAYIATTAKALTDGKPVVVAAATDVAGAAATAAQSTFVSGLDEATQFLVTNGMAKLEKAADGSFSVIPISAKEQWDAANGDTRVGLAEIVSQIKASGAAMASAWSAAMNTKVSAETIGYRLESNAADIADNAKAIADKASWSKLTQQQKDALLEQRSQLQANHIALLVEDTQYGTNAEKVAKLSSLLQSKELHDGLSNSNPDIASMWADVEGVTERELFAIQTGVEAYAKLTGLSYADALQSKEIDAAITAAAAHWLALLPQGMTYDYWLGHPTGTATPGGSTPISTGSAAGTPGGTVFNPPASPPAKIKPQQGYPGSTSFAVGTPFVAYDQLAYIHQGEAVIPAAQNKAGAMGGVTNNYFQFPHYVGSRSELTKAIAQELRIVSG